ncbi:MAG TPA: hypothetical protein VNU26_08275 [Mycobacteriales bacterium]|nr:hypothetical protein [Mycobacteriales bacterium]
MTTPVRLVAFAAVLAAVLAAGLGLGNAVGPVGETGTEPAHASSDDAADAAQPGGAAPDGHGATADGHDDGDDAAHAGPAARTISGLAVSEDGYTLRPSATTLPVGTSPFGFTVTGPDDAPLTRYDTTHERDLHLIVVRRDGAGFQHLHPEMTADGTWQLPLTLDQPGAYRVYADFAPAGLSARTLAADLLVPGDVAVQPWPEPATTTAVDGYQVRLDGHLDAGQQTDLAFSVTRDGGPVELEPYLGALGHLVVLREGDLGYLHVHADGDELTFAATAPSSGDYRLYLQFQVDGVVHTADLTTAADGGHA